MTVKKLNNIHKLLKINNFQTDLYIEKKRVLTLYSLLSGGKTSPAPPVRRPLRHAWDTGGLTRFFRCEKTSTSTRVLAQRTQVRCSQS